MGHLQSDQKTDKTCTNGCKVVICFEYHQQWIWDCVFKRYIWHQTEVFISLCVKWTLQQSLRRSGGEGNTRVIPVWTPQMPPLSSGNVRSSGSNPSQGANWLPRTLWNTSYVLWQTRSMRGRTLIDTFYPKHTDIVSGFFQAEASNSTRSSSHLCLHLFTALSRAVTV